MNTTTLNTAPTIILAVSQIDAKSKEVIEATGGKVHQVETGLLSTLFLVVLPVEAIIGASRRRYYEIAMVSGNLDHIMQLEVSPNVAESSLRYLANYELDIVAAHFANYELFDISAASLRLAAAEPSADLSDLDDGPRA